MGCNDNHLYKLSWGEFNHSLTNTVHKLRRLGDLVDVTLSADGKIFPAHKLVLSAASPLLMEFFKSTQVSHPLVMLAGVSARDLESLLQFVYQGEVTVETNQLPTLVQAAKCLDIKALFPADKLFVSPPVHTDVTEPSPILVTPVTPITKRKKRKLVKNDESESKSEKNKSPSKESCIIKKAAVADLPVTCSICGVMLRQSRNLRRHMELVHLKNVGRKKLPSDSSQQEISEQIDNGIDRENSNSQCSQQQNQSTSNQHVNHLVTTENEHLQQTNISSQQIKQDMEDSICIIRSPQHLYQTLTSATTNIGIATPTENESNNETDLPDLTLMQPAALQGTNQDITTNSNSLLRDQLTRELEQRTRQQQQYHSDVKFESSEVSNSTTAVVYPHLYQQHNTVVYSSANE